MAILKSNIAVDLVYCPDMKFSRKILTTVDMDHFASTQQIITLYSACSVPFKKIEFT